jgi:membrane protease YdiL (CAAX protease family)
MTASEAQPALDTGLPLWYFISLAACLPFTVVAIIRVIRWHRPPAGLQPLDPVPLPPWPGWAGVALFFVMQMTMLLCVIGYQKAAGWGLVPSEAPGGIAMFSPGIFIGQIAPVVLGLVAMRLAGRGTLASVGVRPGRMLTGLWYGVFAFLAVGPLCFAALLVNVGFNNMIHLPVTLHPLESQIQSRREAWVLLVAIIQAGVLAAVSEEIIFRGVLFTSLMREMRPLAAMVMVSVVFASFHVLSEPQAILPLTVLAMAMAYTAYRTRSLLAPMVTHFLFNTTQILALLCG